MNLITMKCAQELEEVVVTAFLKYMNSDQRISVTNQIRHDSTLARASGLGMCDLKTAYERLGIVPSNPELLPSASASYTALLQSGNAMAEMYQSALIWASSSGAMNFNAEIEKSVSDDRLIGRIDALVHMASCSVIVDFKFSMEQWGAPGGPRKNYAYQLMAYNQMLGGSREMALVTIGKGSQFEPAIKVWWLGRDEGGYRFYDTTGTPYRTKRAENWNRPEVLNERELDKLIDSQLAYLSDVREGRGVAVPIKDVLNEDEAWQCARKDYKTMTLRPACPWAGKCHGMYREYKIAKEDGVYTWEI